MKKLLLGNAAVARGAYEAGVKVVSSYPGTPSTEITEEIVKFEEIYAEWAPNEKVAAEVAIGASIGGARAMSCMKHVGLNVMADPVFTVSYTGVSGGLVLCVADDPGMHSSQNEQDSRHYAKASKIMMLEPADSSECKEFTKAAFALSEEFDTPVFIRLSTRVSHSQSLVELGEITEEEARTHERRNVITRALGIGESVTGDYQCFDLHPLDLFLLCSDGLSGMVEESQIESLLSVSEKSVRARCEALIAAALAAGGEDNVTAVLAQTEDEDVASVWEALAEVCTEDITVTYNAHPFHPKTEEDDA